MPAITAARDRPAVRGARAHERRLRGFRQVHPDDSCAAPAEGIRAEPGGRVARSPSCFRTGRLHRPVERLGDGIVPVVSSYLDLASRRSPRRTARSTSSSAMPSWRSGARRGPTPSRRCTPAARRLPSPRPSTGRASAGARRRAARPHRHRVRPRGRRQYRLLDAAQLHGARRHGEPRSRLEGVNKIYGTTIIIGRRRGRPRRPHPGARARCGRRLWTLRGRADHELIGLSGEIGRGSRVGLRVRGGAEPLPSGPSRLLSKSSMLSKGCVLATDRHGAWRPAVAASSRSRLRPAGCRLTMLDAK